MPSYVLQEMSEEMGNGKKKVYPRMQTYSLHDFNTVVRHMHEYGGSFSEGTIRGVLDTLVTTMKSWMPLGHSIKIDGLGVFSLTLGFDTSTPSEATVAKNRRVATLTTSRKPSTDTSASRESTSNPIQNCCSR